MEGNILNQYSAPSFSQHGDDMVLRGHYMFTKLMRREPGVYVDVGAHHPFRYSNTQFFYMSGWRGVNIDPNPDATELFRQHRGNDIFICCGVAAKESSMTYYKFNDPAFNTFDRLTAEKFSKIPQIHVIQELTIECRPLGDILDQCMKQEYLDIFEFMTVDAEGMDLEVLTSNNWQKYRPKFVIYECSRLTVEDAQNTEETKFLTAQGYKMVAKTFNNAIMQRVD